VQKRFAAAEANGQERVESSVLPTKLRGIPDHLRKIVRDHNAAEIRLLAERDTGPRRDARQKELRDARDTQIVEELERFKAAEIELRTLVKGVPTHLPRDAADTARISLKINLFDHVLARDAIAMVDEAAVSQDRPLLAALLPVARASLELGRNGKRPKWSAELNELSRVIGRGERAMESEESQALKYAGDLADRMRGTLPTFLQLLKDGGPDDPLLEPQPETGYDLLAAFRPPER
jgi:hypothetical protein